MKLAVILACVAAALVAAAVAGNFLYRALGRRAERRRMVQACSAPGCSESIFVELVAEAGQARAATATLMDLLHGAECPLRVFVGLYEAVGGPTGAVTKSRVLPMYEDAAELSASAPVTLKDHVRNMAIPAAEFRGSLAAREHMERYLYQGEDFVMTVRAGARLEPGWDKALVDAITGQGADGQHTMITAGLAPRQASAAGTYLAADGRFVPGDNRIPTWQTRPMAGKPQPGVLVPAVGWSADFSFARGSRVRTVPLPSAVLDSADAEPFAVACALVAAGWTLAHPVWRVAWVNGSSYADVDNGVDSGVDSSVGNVVKHAALGAYSRRLLSDSRAKTAFGVSMSDLPTRRAVVGLTDGCKDAEICAKLGSMAQYLSLLSRMELAAVTSATPTTPTTPSTLGSAAYTTPSQPVSVAPVAPVAPMAPAPAAPVYVAPTAAVVQTPARRRKRRPTP